MGEAKRRNAAVNCGSRILDIAPATREAIAAAVKSIVTPYTGRDCILRNGAVATFLRGCGCRASLQFGGMLFRAGPDEMKDVVAFCGRGNRGDLFHENFLGHAWVVDESDPDAVIDLTSSFWAEGATEFLKDSPDGMGDIEFIAHPPEYLWGRYSDYGEKYRGTNRGTPDLGRVRWTIPTQMEQKALAEFIRNAVAELSDEIRATVQVIRAATRGCVHFADAAGMKEAA